MLSVTLNSGAPRYLLRLSGDAEADGAPADADEAPQLCAVDLAPAHAPGQGAEAGLGSGAPALAALAWTQAADGLLSADARGGVAMHRLSGGHLNGGGAAALQLLWRADAGAPQARPPDIVFGQGEAVGHGMIGRVTGDGPMHVLNAAGASTCIISNSFSMSLSTATLQDAAALLSAWAAQVLLSAGAHAQSPAASAAAGAKVATVWWPPVPAEPAHAAGAAPAAAGSGSGSPKRSAKDTLGFSAETRRLLQRLSPTRGGPRGSPKGSPREGRASKEGARAGADGHAAVAAEELRHPAPVVSLQWSPGELQSGVAP